MIEYLKLVIMPYRCYNIAMSSRARLQQIRINDFEAWQEHTDRVLRRSDVQDSLGQLGTQLISLNQNAFLPTVEWFAVDIPAKHQNTDNIGILPVYHEDINSLVPDDSVLQPTPTGKGRISAQLSASGMEATPDAVDACIKRAFSSVSFQERREYLGSERAAATILRAFDYDKNDDGIFVTNRPLIVVNARKFVDTHSLVRGMAGAHELVHCIDFETYDPDKSAGVQAATTELRGYRTAQIIGESVVRAGELTAEQLKVAEPATADIEELRRQYGFDSDELLNGQFEIEPSHPVVIDLIVGSFISIF